MRNTFGNQITITLFGESHGAYIGAVIDGMTPGVVVDNGYIEKELELRRPSGVLSTSRCEMDEFVIVSGVLGGRATGAPITVLIPNKDTRSDDYLRSVARPSHADYTAFVKYGGFEDYRGGGHFSGRITAAIVAAGAIARSALEQKGINIETHIKRIADVEERSFCDFNADFKKIRHESFAVLDCEAGEKMKQLIREAGAQGDSVGGVLESAVTGLPAGVGEPWFDSMESMISHALFSIPAIKGVEFGAGFDISKMRASEANDGMYIDGGTVKCRTNNSGGINGGITNGMPLIVRSAVKPTPSIAIPQKTVDLVKFKNTETEIKGRHDPCIVHRARAVVNSMLALTVCDMLVSQFGRAFLGE